MTAFSAFVRLLWCLPLALVLSGCFLPNEGPVDEEKDPHFQAGKNHKVSLDYDGAISAFENALASNPKSAAAHLELGLFYEEQKNDFGAAIYHFERHLELRPQSNMVETIKQHIMACKLELAKGVSFLLVNRQVQDELRRLYTTNSWLHDQVLQLRTQLIEQAAYYSNKVAQVTQAAATQAQTQSQERAASQSSSYSEEPHVTYTTERVPTPVPTHPAPRPSTMPRTHLVKPGESMAGIAKKYNIKLTALQAFNPSIEARRLRAGQILNLPTTKY